MKQQFYTFFPKNTSSLLHKIEESCNELQHHTTCRRQSIGLLPQSNEPLEAQTLVTAGRWLSSGL
jgi:hypothetical protein